MRCWTFILIPLLFAACSQNNVTEDNSFKKYFDSAGVSGTFGMFDNGQGHFTIYNLPRFRDSAYLPAGTFDLLLSLIGIQTGLVKDDTALATLGRENGFSQLALRLAGKLAGAKKRLMERPPVSTPDAARQTP